jgi:multiple sugar transport system substrate-binding protein
VRDIARILTVDENGNDATSPDFDREAIVQIGYSPQWQSATSWGTFFGAAKMYNDNNEAVVPESFRTGWEYVYDGMWGEQPFIASGPLAAAPEFGNGNVFNAGKTAMAVTQTWYTCCLADLKNAGVEFQMGVLPSYNGEVHGRIDADTFRVWKGTAHPAEAFEVLSYLIGEGSKKLLPIYGAMPARAAETQAFFDAKSKDYPFVTQESWDVFVQGLAYPDTPSAEGYMPNWQESWNRIQTFQDLLNNTPDLDIDAEIATLEADLTAIFQK